MRHAFRSTSPLLGVALAILVACGGGESTGPTVASVTIAPAAFTLYPGQVRTLTAVAADEGAAVIADADFTWSASAPGVATVSSSGLVTAVAAGMDTIRATSDGIVGLAILTVTAVPVDSVVVTPAPTTVHLTQTKQLAASVRDSAGNALVGRSVVWASSDSAKATVSGTGLVTGVAIGSVTITATSEGHQGVSVVTVDSIPVATILLVPAGDTVQVGDTLTPVAVPKDAGGNVMLGQTVTWGVNDSSLLQPISGNRFVAMANGSAVLSATIGDVTKTGSVLSQTCGDTLNVAAGSFNFPLVSGGLATDVSGLIDAGLFKGNAAWYGAGVMYGTDSAHMVVAREPSGNLGNGAAKRGICQVASAPAYARSYSKVAPAVGANGPAGLRVVQETYTATSTSADSAFVLFRYTFTNTTGTNITGLRVGYIIDWDLGADPGTNVLTYSAANTVHLAVESDSLTHTEHLGLVGASLVGTGTSRGWLNGADPTTRGAYYAVLALGTSTANSGPMDIRALAGIPAVTVPAYGRVVVYFAVIGGTTSAKFGTSFSAAMSLASSLGYF